MLHCRLDTSTATKHSREPEFTYVPRCYTKVLWHITPAKRGIVVKVLNIHKYQNRPISDRFTWRAISGPLLICARRVCGDNKSKKNIAVHFKAIVVEFRDTLITIIGPHKQDDGFSSRICMSCLVTQLYETRSVIGSVSTAVETLNYKSANIFEINHGLLAVKLAGAVKRRVVLRRWVLTNVSVFIK